MIKARVTNIGPKIVTPEGVDKNLLLAFRSDEQRNSAAPFEHQAKGWTKISQNEEVGLVAGTAAGKTLTTAVPLLDKLFRQKSIRKILFLYPTLALLEDQYDTLRKLLKHYVETSGANISDIGRVKGGLTSSQLLQALSKPIIVATPDSVYWFFRKNIKYNAFLIYGLLQVDEVVLDEAHLFTGLMLENAKHLLDRMRFLKSEYLGQELRVHYLTATSREEISELSPQAIRIPGQSKCGDVDLVFEEKMPVWEREAPMADLTKNLLAQGKQHILVVCNSARRAHRLFDTLCDNRRSAAAPDLPQIFWKTFGLVEIGSALPGLESLDVQTAKWVEEKIREDIPLTKKNIQRLSLKLNPEYCAAPSAEWLEMKHGEARRAIYRYAREAEKNFDGDSLHNSINPELRKMLGLSFRAQPDLEAALAHLDQQIDHVSDWVEENWSRFGSEFGYLHLADLSPSAFRNLINDSFSSLPANVTTDLTDEMSRYLSRNLTLNAQSVANLSELGMAPYARHKISIRRLLAWVEDKEIREAWEALLLTQVKPQHGAVGVLRDDPNGAVVILYSGSMARYAREGLIELFKNSELRRPAVLIATSAVEVGVDFAADALITEECPASGFLQRFGRVGRREGLQSLVHVLVSGEAYKELAHHLTGRTEITRDEFSTLLTAHLERGFVERKYLHASDYAKAAQRIVNQQLGQVGQVYDIQQADPASDDLVKELIEHGIDPAYGLRGTLPGVALADSGVSKDPFYILNYVSNEDIEPPASPFEMARLQRYFNELIYRGWQRTVIVDIESTLKRNQVIVVPERHFIGGGKGEQSPAQKYCSAKQYATHPPEIRTRFLAARYQFPPTALDAPYLLLGYGDVYLAAVDKETDQYYGIETFDRERLRLRDQWYLILLDCNEERAKQYLERADAAAFENEIYYDFEGVKKGVNNRGVVLLERQTGAIWEIWQRLREIKLQ